MATLRSCITDASAAAKAEITAAATAHGVRINAKATAFSIAPKSAIVHAPLAGIAKLSEDDYAAGAEILLLVVSSGVRGDLPNGSYVVKAQIRRGRRTGKALLIDRRGKLVAERELRLRTARESAAEFPEVYGEPAGIPNITSTHIFFPDPPHPPREFVDCTGVLGTLYFSVQ
jgi:hypothetical protein